MAGADYFQTQAVYEPEKFIKFMEKASQFGKPVQLGIVIPKSAGMAKFMNKNVAGIHVPDDMIEELARDKEKTKAGITGVEIAARIIKECEALLPGRTYHGTRMGIQSTGSFETGRDLISYSLCSI